MRERGRGGTPAWSDSRLRVAFPWLHAGKTERIQASLLPAGRRRRRSPGSGADGSEKFLARAQFAAAGHELERPQASEIGRKRAGPIRDPGSLAELLICY